MNKKSILFSTFSLVLIGFISNLDAYTVTIHNRDWRDHKVKIDITGGADKHPVIKAGTTEKIGVGGFCTRAVEIESPGSRAGARIDHPGGNCGSWTVWITRDSDKNKWLSTR